MESNELVEGFLENLECPKALGKFEAGAGPEHGGDVILETGLFQVQCKTSASGKAVWPAKPIDVSIIKAEEKITVKAEEKNPPTFVDHLLAIQIFSLEFFCLLYVCLMSVCVSVLGLPLLCCNDIVIL
jgi:hypothetical protein